MAFPVPAWISTPSMPLFAIVLPSPAAVPPMTLLFEPFPMTIPRERFGRAVRPSTLVPMKLPRIWFPPSTLIRMPLELLPEMTLRASAEVPPMTLFDASNRSMPSILFPDRRCRSRPCR